jgi:hypothetical protein
MNGLKLIIFLAFVSFVSSNTIKRDVSAHHHSSTCDTSVSATPEFDEKWNAASKYFKGLAKEMGKPALSVFAIFERSICKSCVEKKLVKFELLERFNNFTDRMEELDDLEEVQFPLIFAGAGLLCSSKVRPIQEFVFDAIMAVGHIVRALKDEPELHEYFFFLRCANNYVIRKHYWENSEYAINSELDEDEKFQCKMFTDEIEKTIKETIEDSGEDKSDEECSTNIIEKTIPFVMRTILLAQVNLTPEQLENERQNFFKKEKELNEHTAKCFFHEIFEIDIETYNALKSSSKFNDLKDKF